MAGQPLFRAEVTQRVGVQWLGKIRVSQPSHYAWWTAGAAALALGLVCFGVFGQYARTTELHGVLSPAGGVMEVTATQSAIVAQVLVTQGQAVKAGTPLARLVSDRVVDAGALGALRHGGLATQEASLESERRILRAQSDQREHALRERLRSLEAESKTLQADRSSYAGRLDSARKSAAKFADLARDGIVTQQQADRARDELLELEQRERSVSRNLEAARREALSLAAEISTIGLQWQSASAGIDRQVSQLQQQQTVNRSESDWLVVAPLAAVVAAIHTKPGQAVAAGGGLLSMLPGTPEQSKLRAHLFAPSSAIGFLSAGQDVWITYAAFPRQRFGRHKGVIRSISATPIHPMELQRLGVVRQTDQMYQIEVELASQVLSGRGAERRLQSGMALSARVQHESWAVWEWLARPLRGG